jgi:hypothetical protein
MSLCWIRITKDEQRSADQSFEIEHVQRLASAGAARDTKVTMRDSPAALHCMRMLDV